MDDGLVPTIVTANVIRNAVLILIVVDDGLVHSGDTEVRNTYFGLNPYCSGRWSRTAASKAVVAVMANGLNPYCSGRWSRTG